ncbi:MAG: hypothetical protein N3C57_06865, partial [Aquificaceae bacterium]|nr:hypothetical protein [Aquificaceae bacterium]
MKKIYLNGEKSYKLFRHLPIVIAMIVVGVCVWLFFIYLENKFLNSFYRYKTEEIKLMWKTATIANMEAIASYYSKLMDRETIQILKLARSGEEKDLILARQKLLAHLWSRYEILREGYGVKGLIFVTPDNRVLIRLHAPHVYGDDFSQVYPALKNLRDSKQPTHGFAILRLVSG